MTNLRYDSVSRYLSPGPNVSGCCDELTDNLPTGSEFYREEYNDVPYTFDPEIYNQLIDGN